MATHPNEPHIWEINITCPKCGHTGDLVESFPCCSHVEQATAEATAAERERIARQVEALALITSVRWPEWARSVKEIAAAIRSEKGGA